MSIDIEIIIQTDESLIHPADKGLCMQGAHIPCNYTH